MWSSSATRAQLASSGLGSCPAMPTSALRCISATAARRAGKVGNGTGFNAYAIRTANDPAVVAGALKIRKNGYAYLGLHAIPSHMEGATGAQPPR